jgi:pilus assembly protein CpaF
MSDMLKAKQFIETSVLLPLLNQQDITDISFNGEALFYQSSRSGRQRATIAMNAEQAYVFVKQLANFMNVPFTYVDPLVDLSVERYRLFAVGQAISRKQYQPSITFSLRIHPPSGYIHRWFIPEGSSWETLFLFLITKGYSLVIAGKTGVGKTQFQKELLTLMPRHQRIIVVDNILELDGLSIPGLDMTIWQATQTSIIPKLIEAALRSNPDWLLIAESRGEEFKEVYRSVRTGHPIITTIHSDTFAGIYPRMVSLLLMHEQATMMAQFHQDVQRILPVTVLLTKTRVHDHIDRRIAGVQIILNDQPILILPHEEEKMKAMLKQL